MLQLMLMIFIMAGKLADYKAECSSHHAENTFLCMRLNPRGLTPSETGMDDRQRDEKGQPQGQTSAKIPTRSINIMYILASIEKADELPASCPNTNVRIMTIPDSCNPSPAGVIGTKESAVRRG
jgi:hypothetical protein